MTYPSRLDDFLSQFELPVEHLCTLMSRLWQLELTPPTCRETENTPYFFAGYKFSQTTLSRLTLETMRLVVSKQLSWLKGQAQLSYRYPDRDQDNVETYSRFLAFNAIAFGVTSEGNCANRSALAASALFSVLPNTVEIVWKSYHERDQYVVQLTLEDRSVWIYDPLTNPTLIFPKLFYEAEVLPCFALITRPAEPLELPVTPYVQNQFWFLRGVMAREIRQQIAFACRPRGMTVFLLSYRLAFEQMYQDTVCLQQEKTLGRRLSGDERRDLLERLKLNEARERVILGKAATMLSRRLGFSLEEGPGASDPTPPEHVNIPLPRMLT